MLNASNAAGIDKVEAVARAFGLEAWMLLVPDLDPSDPFSHVLRKSEAGVMRSLALAAETLRRYGS